MSDLSPIERISSNPSINEVIRERKAVFRMLKRTLKRVDTDIEEAERYINRIINRKRKVPTQFELQWFDQWMDKVDQHFRRFAEEFRDGVTIFTNF